MSLVINNNTMATFVARNLNQNYKDLGTSVQRLSSGLRINSAADDAAGLAIRELQRAEITALRQGIRNTNDAVSLVQTADGALQVIDEILIRMKELTMQAATGTYTSAQRGMIDDEFVTMGTEINRILQATDFNGIHLLDGSLSGTHDGTGLDSKGNSRIHFGPSNNSAQDYYDINIPNLNIFTNLMVPEGLNWPGATYEDGKITFTITNKYGGNGENSWKPGIDQYTLPIGLENVIIESKSGDKSGDHKPHISIFTKDGAQITGPQADDPTYNSNWWNNMNPATDIVGDPAFNPGATYDNSQLIPQGDTGSVTINESTIKVVKPQIETRQEWEEIHIDVITDDLLFFVGGHNGFDCNLYDIKITAEVSAIDTQDKAEKMLERIDRVIIDKDAVRADLGAIQNRLESTVNNLTIQAERLQASESRISDVDAATEMTILTRGQILTQSSLAMLAQANTLPQMAMKIIQG